MTSQPPKDTGTTAQDDVSGEARLNYFVYKVGAGNFWLDGWRDLGGLYVGFEDTHASADPKKPSIRVRSPEKVFESRTGNDDDNIARIATGRRGEVGARFVWRSTKAAGSTSRCGAVMLTVPPGSRCPEHTSDGPPGLCGSRVPGHVLEVV